MTLYQQQLFFDELILIKNMIKNFIAPMQAWLLSQGRCVGCGTSLKKGVQKPVRGQITVTCQCGRIFIYDKSQNKYRRALFDEI